MIDDPALNLVNVYGKIEAFKSSIIRRIKAFLRLHPALEPSDRTDLEEIQARVRLIETNQQAYFLAHQPKGSKDRLTQADLLKQDEATQLSTLNYTHQQIKALLADITQPKGHYYRLYQKYPNLFEKIISTLRHMLRNLEKDRRNPSQALSLSENEKMIFSGKKLLYQLASALDGRYRVFNQALDPLRSGEGDCYGHIRIWAEQIANTHQSTQLPRADQGTRAKQIYQRFYRIKETEIASFSTKTQSLSQISDQILRNTNTSSIYGLGLSETESSKGHRVGLRRIPGTHEIEFNDPNYGIFVFKDEQIFKIWFMEFLREEFPRPIEIYLTKMEAQPKQAIANVPEIKTEIETKVTLSFPTLTPSRDHSSSIQAKLSKFYKNIRCLGICVIRRKLVGADCDKDLKRIMVRNRNAFKQFLKHALAISDEVKQEQKTDEDEKEAFILKERVCTSIDIQLTKKPLSSLQKQGFLELKKQINAASLCVPLEVLIEQFLTEKLKETTQSWQEILYASSIHKSFIAHSD